MLTRAFAALEVKRIDVATREIEGIATTPTADRGGDVIDPTGASFTLPMPLLWQHDHRCPVGEVIAAHVDAAGIRVTARFAQVEEPGALRDTLDHAWQSVKARLVRGLSIGFKPLEAEPRNPRNPSSGLHIKRWLWAELSAVTIPMNVEATILNIKSAALGHPLPGVAGLSPETRPMQTFAERIAARETTRTDLIAKMAALMEDGDTLTTLADADAAKYSDYSAQVKSIDADLGRLRELETLNRGQAAPIATERHGLPVVSVKANVEKGTAFVRYAMAMLQAKGDSLRAMENARRWRDSTPEVELMVKAAVAPGDTTTPAWAGVLVQIQNAQNEFLALLRPETILGKISNLRKVPFNTQVPLQTGGGTYGWVGQGAPKPVTKLALTTTAIQFSKAAGIIVITEELAKLSSPDAETIVRGDMIGGIAQFLDSQFIDPAVAVVANVSPASITNGAGTAASSDNASTDLGTILNHFSTAGYPLSTITLIMSEKNALAMGMKRDAMGNKVFPSMGVGGGSAEGIKIIASNTAGANVIGLSGPDILYADEGGVSIDVSREASVVMDSDPANAVGPVLRSFWQDNLVGLRAERMINWQRARTSAVYYLTDAAYTV
jgi:HK97 family phage major capsid protein/HK97 family phage prohead protease